MIFIFFGMKQLIKIILMGLFAFLGGCTGKKQGDAIAELTKPESFKNRVEWFWTEFEAKEAALRETMDTKADSDSLVERFAELLEIAFDKPYFEVGGTYDLIMTPEGDRTKLPMLYYWWLKAPESLKSKWRFFYTRQASAEGFGLRMYDVEASGEDVTVYYTVDDERQKVDMEIYCPKFVQLDENQRYSYLFILLDQCIGELHTIQHVGYIDFLDAEKPGDAVPLSGLKKILDNAVAENNWPGCGNPLEMWSNYEIAKPMDDDGILRSDIFVGYTNMMPLIESYFGKENIVFDEMLANGVVCGFMYYDNSEVPQSEIVPFRSRIEDEIEAIYSASHEVFLTGGATGSRNSYIDMVVFDFASFLPQVRAIAEKYGLKNCGFGTFKQGFGIIKF